jgi:hypothetical protein
VKVVTKDGLRYMASGERHRDEISFYFESQTLLGVLSEDTCFAQLLEYANIWKTCASEINVGMSVDVGVDFCGKLWLTSFDL